MIPPGRRKGLSLLSLSSLLLLLLLSTSAHAASAVLGIDLGTEYLKAALVKPGIPLEIVLTKDSRRKEAATLAFKPSRAQTTDPDAFPERLYGADAVALAGRFPGDVYPNLKSLLGVSKLASMSKAYQNNFPGLDVVAFPRNETAKGQGTVAFRSKNIGPKQEAFMVEELLAMELQNIKTNAETAAGKGSLITDVVITYPPFYTVEEKRALELATDLAGLRLLSMVSDGMAVGINYATSRTFDSISEGGNPEYHLVYDMGAGSTTATLLRFQGRIVKDGAKRNKTIQEVQVLGTGYDQTLGGDTLNALIVNNMVEKFLERPKMKAFGLEEIHVKKEAKTMARFWKEAERLRQVLSANSQGSASFEGLYYEDVSFSYKLGRADFEKLVSEHAPRVSTPLTTALNAAGVTLQQLDSIILHGGTVRTPFVQKQLEIVAGGSSKIKTNVNADEAAVMGAAFKAAGISPSFRVKDIRAGDISGVGVGLKWMAEGKERSQKLFTSTSQVGTEKQVPVKVLENVKLQFTHDAGGRDVVTTEVEATNLTASVSQLKDKYGCAPANISTKFTMRLRPTDGLPEVVSGSVSCESDAGAKEGSVLDGVKGMFGFGSKKDASQEPLDDIDVLEPEVIDPTTMTPEPLDDSTSSGSTVSETTFVSSTATKSTKKSAPTVSTVTIPLALSTRPRGLNLPLAPATLSRIRGRLASFAASDRQAALRSEALNTLEGFTYRARDYLTDESFIAVSSQNVRDELEKKLNAASEWLYADGVDAKTKDFKDKLDELKKIIDPALMRKDESSKRDNAVVAVRDQLSHMESMINMVNSSIAQAAVDAASAASATISAATESVASVAESVAEAVTGSPSAETGDELDDDPYSTPTTSSAKSKPTEPIYTPPSYTAEDLSTLQKSYDSVKTWLDEKLALQEKLTPYDDPAMLVKDLDARAKQLQTDVTNLIMKSVKMPPKNKPRSSSSKKSKSKKGKSSTTLVAGATVVDEGSSTATASSSTRSGHGEL